MTNRRLLSSVVVLAFFVGGCAPEGKLRRRAAFDLNCPESRLHVVDLGGMTRGVEGCDHRGTYIWVCTQQGPCEWVMDSSAKIHPGTEE